MSIFQWLLGGRDDRRQHRQLQAAKAWNRKVSIQSGFTALEARQVLNAAPVAPVELQQAAAPAEVIVNAGAAANDGQGDVFHVSRQGDQVQVSLNGEVVQTVSAGQELVIQGSSDQDRLEIDFSGGNPLDIAAVHFEGGSDAGNQIVLTGGEAQSVTHTLLADGSSAVTVDGGQLTYSGGVRANDELLAADRVFRVEGDDESITVTDHVSDGSSELTTASGHSVTFAAPEEWLRIDTADAAADLDSVTIAGLDASFTGNLSVNGDGGDAVALNGQWNLQGGDLTVSAGRITVNGQVGSQGATVELTGSQTITVNSTGAVQNAGGQIILDAGTAGTLWVAGVVDASDAAAGATGGTIHLLGKDVALDGSALLDASGNAGGGTILVGGDYQGKNPEIHNASRVYIGPNATLRANAGESDNGGKVIVWADDIARFLGTIEARGGSQSGDGGFVETSSKDYLEVLGTVDASAANGAAGLWLLDPRNVDLVLVPPSPFPPNDNSSGGAFNFLNPNVFTPIADNAIADIDVIESSLNAGTNVIITTGGTGGQDGDITVVNDITKSAGGNATLSLLAADDIVINPGVTIQSTSGTLTVDLQATGGDIDTSGATIITNGGSVTANAAAGAVTLGNITTGVGGLSVTANGAITDADGTTLSVGGLASFSGSSITLGDNAGDTTNFGTLTFNSGGAVTIQEDSDTALAGANTADSVFLNSAGAITDGSTSLAVTNLARFNGTSITLGGAGITTNFGRVRFNSAGAVNIQEDSGLSLSGASTADSLVLDAAGTIDNLASASLTVTNNASFTATGTIALGNNVSDSMDFGSVTFSGATSVIILEDSDTTLAGVNSSTGSLQIVSTGALTDSSTSLSVTGDAAFGGTSVTIGGAGITTNLGTVRFNSAGAVTIQEDSDTVLAFISIADSLSLTSTGTITDSSTSVAVTNNASFSGTAITVGGAGSTTNFGSLTFNSGGAVNIQEDSTMTVSGDSTAGAGLTLNATGDINLNAIVGVTGATSITATGAIDVNAKLTGTTTILLDAGDNIIIDAAIDPTTVTLESDDDVVINDAVVAEDLITVSAGQDGTGSVFLNATGSLTVDNAGNTSDITITSGATAGSITLDGTTTADDLVSIISPAGSITGAGLITASRVELDAGTNIGSTGTRIQTSVNNLEARAANGGIFITEANGVTVGGVGVLTGLQTTGGNGDIDLQTTAGAITVSEAVSANGSGDVTLNAAGLLTVNAAVSSTSGDLSLTGGTGVTHNAAGDLTTGTTGTIGVTATTGGISMADGTVYSTGSGDVALLATTGNIALGRITTTGNVNVTATAGNITDNTAAEGAGDENIAGGIVSLSASTGIGAAGAAGDIDTAATTLISSTATGGIYLTETDGAALGTTSTTSGDVVIVAGGALTTSGNISTAGNGNIDISTTAGSITLSNTVTANGSGTVTVNAGGAGSDVNVNAVVSSTSGDITLTAADAIALGANVSTTGNVVATATAGSITRTAGSVIGNIVRFLSGGAIGASGAANRVQTSATTLEAQAAGDIYITEANAVTIGGAGGVVGISTTANNGLIDVETTSGTITVSEAVTAHGTGTVRLAAQGAGSDLAVNAVVSSTSGNINLSADDAVTLAANVTTDATGATGDTVSINSTNGAITRTAGTVTALNLSLVAETGIGGATNAEHITTAVSNVAARNDAGGGVYIRNTGGLTVTTLGGVVGVSTVGGGIHVEAASPLTVNSDVVDSGGGNIVLAAEGNAATDDLTINANVTASGGTGNIELYAGDTIALGAAGIVSAASTGAVTARAGTDYNGGTLQDGTNAGDITMNATSAIRSQDGVLTLRAPGSISLAEVNANSNADGTAGNVFITADDSGVSGTQSNNVGAITDANAATLNVTANGLSLRAATGIATSADRLETNVVTVAGLNTTSGGIYLDEVAAGGDLVVGTVGVTAGLDTSGANGDVNVRVNSGDLDIDDPIDAGTGTVRLRASGYIRQTANILAQSLAAVSDGDTVDLSLATNNVTYFAGSATASGQAVNYQDADSFEVGSVTADNIFAATVNGIAVNNTDGIVRLQAVTGDITQTEAITGSRLGAVAVTGTVDLSLATNDVNYFAARAATAGEEVNFQDADGFEVASVTAGGGPLNDRLFTAPAAGSDLDGITVDSGDGIVRLQAVTGNITQTEAITGSRLGAVAVTGTVDLSLATNDVNYFAARAAASGQAVNFQDADGYEVASVTAGGGPTSDRLFTAPAAGSTLNGITVNAADGTVRLQAPTGNITQSQAIVGYELGVVANTGYIDLSLATNNVTEFAARATAAGQYINYRDADGFRVDTVTAGGGPTDDRLFDTDDNPLNAGADLVGIQANTTDGIVRLRAGSGSITQTAAAAVVTYRLGAEVADAGGAVAAGQNVALCTADNDVDIFAARAGGAVALRDADSFMLGTVTAGGTLSMDLTGVTSTDVELVATDDLVVNDPINITGTVRLESMNGSITQTATITADALSARAATFIDLTTQDNDVNTFAAYVNDDSAMMAVATTDRYVYFRDTDGVTVGFVASGACVADTTGVQVITDTTIPTTVNAIEILAGPVLAGDLTLNETVSVTDESGNPAGFVRLWTPNGSITQGSDGAVVADRFSARASVNIYLCDAMNDVNYIAAIAGSNVTFYDIDGLTVDSVTGGTLVTMPVTGVTAGVGFDVELWAADDLTLQEAVSAVGGTVRLQAGDDPTSDPTGGITQTATGAITAQRLSAYASEEIDLCTPDGMGNAINNVDYFAATAVRGSVYYRDLDNLTIDTVAAGSCIGAQTGVSAFDANSIEIRVGGNLDINQRTAVVDLATQTTPTGFIRLQADTGYVQQTDTDNAAANGEVVAANLSVQADGVIDLCGSDDNDADVFAATSTTGSVFFRDVDNLIIGTVAGGTCITTAQTGVRAFDANVIEIRVGTNLDINQRVAVVDTATQMTPTGYIRLQADAGYVQQTDTDNAAANGEVVAANLSVQADDTIDLCDSDDNDVDVFAATSTTGSVYFRDEDDLIIGTVTGGVCVSGVQIGVRAFDANSIEIRVGTDLLIYDRVAVVDTATMLTPTGAIRLQADTGFIQQFDFDIPLFNGEVVAANLSVQADGVIDLCGSDDNDADVFAATSTNGSVYFRDVDNLTIGTVTGGMCITTAQTGVRAFDANVIEIRVGTNLDINQRVAVVDTATQMTPTGYVRLQADAGYVQQTDTDNAAANGEVVAANLSVQADDTIDLCQSDDNDVDVFAATSTTGSVYFRDVDDLIIGAVTGGVCVSGGQIGVRAFDANSIEIRVGGNLDINQRVAVVDTATMLTPTGTIRLQADTGYVQQTDTDNAAANGEVVAANLSVQADDNIDLCQSDDNDADVFAATSTTGSVYFRDVDNLTIGTVAGGMCITTAQTGVRAFDANVIEIRVATNLDINQRVTVVDSATQMTPTGYVRLQADTGYVQQRDNDNTGATPTNGQIVAANLSVQAEGTIDLCQSDDNDVDVFAATSNTGSVRLRDRDDLTIGTVAGGVCVSGMQIGVTAAMGDVELITGGDLSLENAVTAGNATRLYAMAGDITQTAAITSNYLSAVADTGDIDLSLETNDVNVFAARARAASRQINFRDIDGFEVGTVDGVIDPLGNNNALVYSDARPLGSRDGSIQIVYVDPGAANATLDVTTVTDGMGNTVITVQLATDGSGTITTTAADVRNLINGDPDASLIVTAADAAGNDGTGLVTAASRLGPVSGITANETSGAIRLHANTGNITQTEAIIGDALGVLATDPTLGLGNIDLCLLDGMGTPVNDVNTFAAYSASGSVYFSDVDSVTVGSVSAGGGPLSNRMFDIDNDIGAVTPGVALTGVTATASGQNIELWAVDDLTLDAPVLANLTSGTVRLQAGLDPMTDPTGNITQTAAGRVEANALSAYASQGIDLCTPDGMGNAINDVNYFAATAVRGSVLFRDIDDLTIDTVTGGTCITTSQTGVRAFDANSIEIRVGTNLDINQRMAVVDSATQLTPTGAIRLQADAGYVQQTDTDNAAANGEVVAANLSVQANGDIDLCQSDDNDVDVFAATSTTGSVFFRDRDDLTIGTVTDGTCITVAQTGVTATADNQVIELWARNNLIIDAPVLANLANGVVRLQAGQAVPTAIETDSITQTASGRIEANQLSAKAAGDIDLCHALNDVNTFAAYSANGSIYFQDIDDLDIGMVAGGVCVVGAQSGLLAPNGGIELVVGGDLVIDVAINVAGTVRLESTGGSVSQIPAGTITANALSARAQTFINLTAANDVNIFAAEITGGTALAVDDRYVYFNDVDDLTIGAVADGMCAQGATGIVMATNTTDPTTVNAVEVIANAGNLTLDEAIRVTNEASAPSGVVRLWTPAGNITQDAEGAVVTNAFSATASGSIDLFVAPNDADIFAATGGGNVQFSDIDNLEILEVAAGTFVTTGNVGVTSSNGSIEIQTLGPAGVGGNLTVSRDVTAVAAGQAVTLRSQNASILSAANLGAIVRGSTVNLIAGQTIGAGTINTGVLEANQDDIDWTNSISGNLNGIYVAASTLNLSNFAGGAINGDVWVDVDPFVMNGTTIISPFMTTGNAVITSEQTGTGTINVQNIAAAGRILIQTDTDNVALGGLNSTLAGAPTNTIAVDAGGALTALGNFAILTDKMLLIQLLPNANFGTPDAPLVASTPEGLTEIYADRLFFVVQNPFPAPDEATVRPLQFNSITATYGISNEFGFVVTIDWGDGTPPTTMMSTDMETAGSAGLTIEHYYDVSDSASYLIVLTAAVDPSISLESGQLGNRTYYEERTMYAEVLVNAAPPLINLAPLADIEVFAKPPEVITAPPEAAQPPTPLPPPPLVEAPEIVAPEKDRFLELLFIPEDGSDPVKVELSLDGGRTKVSKLPLSILQGDKLLKQFKSLQDGRYRLVLVRTLGEQRLIERDLLDVILKNGVPVNQVEQQIERLQRTLQLDEANDQGSGAAAEHDADDARSAVLQFEQPGDAERESIHDGEMAAAGVAAVLLGHTQARTGEQAPAGLLRRLWQQFRRAAG